MKNIHLNCILYFIVVTPELSVINETLPEHGSMALPSKSSDIPLLAIYFEQVGS